MRNPKTKTVAGFTDAVRDSNRKLQIVSDQKLELIVGLVLRIIAEKFLLDRDKLINLATDQLRKKGYGIVQVWILKWVLTLVVDVLVDWFKTNESSPYKKITIWIPYNLPKLEK